MRFPDPTPLLLSLWSGVAVACAVGAALGTPLGLAVWTRLLLVVMAGLALRVCARVL